MTIKVVRMSISVSRSQRKKLEAYVSQTGMNLTQIFGMMIDKLRVKDAIADKKEKGNDAEIAKVISP